MLDDPFSFDGRIRRTEYGISFILAIVLRYLVVLIVKSIDLGGGSSLIALVVLIPVFWFQWAQGAKRAHDMDCSGWYQLIPFYFLALIFVDGKRGVNGYGSNPKGLK